MLFNKENQKLTTFKTNIYGKPVLNCATSDLVNISLRILARDTNENYNNNISPDRLTRDNCTELETIYWLSDQC